VRPEWLGEKMVQRHLGTMWEVPVKYRKIVAQTADSKLHIGFSTRTAYDSNILRTEDLNAIRPGTSKEDIRVTPSVDLDIAVPIGRHSAFLSGGIGYVFHNRNKQLDRESINLTGGGNLRFSTDCSTALSSEFVRQQTDLADFRTRILEKNTEQRVGVSVGVNCTRPIGLTSSIGVDIEDARNSNVLRQSGEYKSLGFRASVGYSHPALGEAAVFASYNKGKYPNRQQLIPARGSEQVDFGSVGLQYSRNITRQFKGSASIGYSSVDPNTSGVRKFKGASYSLDVTWTPSDSFQGLIGASRSVQQSSTLDVSYSIINSYRLSGRYALSPEWQLNFGASHNRRNFRESPLVPVLVARGKDRTTQVTAGARFAPPGPISFSLDVSAAKLNSDVRQFRYNNVIAGLSVRYGF
jgi:hypothetical protein